MRCILKAFIGVVPGAARTTPFDYRTLSQGCVETACHNTNMPDSSPRSRPVAFAVFLIIAGALGLLAAWELSVEKVLVLADPEHVPACNVGVLVGCGVNLDSWQGSVFGFPNPFIGIDGLAGRHHDRRRDPRRRASSRAGSGSASTSAWPERSCSSAG